MRLDTILSTLSDLSTFAGRVTIASDTRSAVDAVSPFKAMPCCVIHGIEESANEDRLAWNHAGIGSGPQHLITIAIRLLTVGRDVSDPHGAAAYEQIETARANAAQALLGLVPDTDHTPMVYSGGQIVFAEAGTLMWLDHWQTTYYLSRTS